MKSREQRDGEAVVITTTVLWLAVGTVCALLLHAGLARVAGLEDGSVSTVLLLVLLGCAAAGPLRYLHRHRRP